MRRKWVISAVVLVAVSGVALVAAAWVRDALRPHGSLTFPEQVDLGAIEPGNTVEASFTIQNQSSQYVRLADFASDCGCLGLFRQAPAGPAPLEPVLLSPGQELAVGARYKAPGGGNRAFAHRVTFTADPPAPQPTSVLLTGTVQLPMYAEPGIVSWGTLRPHQTAEQVLRLVDLRKPAERTPFTLVSDRDSVTVESVEEARRTEDLPRAAEDGRVYCVKLKLQAGGQGEVSGRVHVRCGDEETAIHAIPFYASVVPAVRLVPPTLVLPRAGEEDPFSGRMLIRSDEMRSDESPGQLTLGPAPKGFLMELDGRFLVVRCDRDAPPEPGMHKLAVDVKTADGTTHQLSLMVVIARSWVGKPGG
jgi:hypothetical protein